MLITATWRCSWASCSSARSTLDPLDDRCLGVRFQPAVLAGARGLRLRRDIAQDALEQPKSEFTTMVGPPCIEDAMREAWSTRVIAPSATCTTS